MSENIFIGPKDGCPECGATRVTPIVVSGDSDGGFVAAYVHSCGRRWMTRWGESVVDLPYNWSQGLVAGGAK